MSNERMWSELEEICNYDIKEIEETLKYLNDRLEVIKEDMDIEEEKERGE